LIAGNSILTYSLRVLREGFQQSGIQTG